MVELAAFDDAERQRLRDALKQFKRSHGNLGDFKLYGLMRDILNPQHLVYLSQSTMQRFIRSKGRTTDEAVWAIKTFLERVSPPGYTEAVPTALVDILVVPVMTVPQVFEPLENYYGRYDFFTQAYTGQFFETKFEEPSRAYCVLFPSADPRFLCALIQTTEDRTASGNIYYFFRCGTYQFLLLGLGIGGATFALLSHFDDDPVILQGTWLQPAGVWPPNTPPYEVRLVRTHTPPVPVKQKTGQYGKKEKGHPEK